MTKNKDYDKKLFRFVKILNFLQDRKSVTTAQLAEEFNTSLRTAQRDIRRLGMAGFPIEESETEKGVYSFFEGYSLKSLPVSNEEASLLTFLCEIAKTMGTGFENAFKSIFAKVVMTNELDSPYHAIMPVCTVPNSPFSKDIETAIDETKKIKLAYKKDDKETTFILYPLKMIFWDGLWYLWAQIEGKPYYPKFRFDKIVRVEILDEEFKAPPKNIQQMLTHSTNIWFGEKRNIRAVLKIDSDCAEFFTKKKFFPLQKIKKTQKDGSVILETMLCHHMEAIPVILRWLPHVRVIEPKELREQITEQVKKYFKKS